MNRLHRTNNRLLLLSVLMLATALLFVQGFKLHIHDFDHDGGDTHSTFLSDTSLDHHSQGGAHSSLDSSHVDHHLGSVSELDATQDGLLKNTLGKLLPLIFAVIAFFIFPFIHSRRVAYRRRDEATSLPRRYLLYPPLRAPPL